MKRIFLVVALALLSSTAQAIIGMPLTPFSFAGVARRTTRRAVWMGAAAAPYYGAPAYAPPPYYPPPYAPPPAYW
jgi:hypothetical protein